mmetsp:Transcript_37752/g.94925  ORF Transcript_37752/g.94925 Transcript_37752/m.94925 type:complete len:239 (-) Transcript_37752:55-771(-)
MAGLRLKLSQYVWRLLVILLSVASAGSAFLLFVVSLLQLKENTHTRVGAQIHCEADGWNSHRPIAFRFQNDPQTLICSWYVFNSIMRICGAIFGILLVPLLIFGMVKARRLIVFTSTIAAAILFTGFFVVMCMDTNDVRVSSAWCRKGLQGVNWSEQPALPVDCDYLGFILMILTDLLAVLIWGLTTLFLALYVKWFLPKQNPFEYAGLNSRVQTAVDLSVQSGDDDDDEEEDINELY